MSVYKCYYSTVNADDCDTDLLSLLGPNRRQREYSRGGRENVMVMK